MKFIISCLVLLVFATPCVLAGPGEDSWDNLAQLREGQKIEVIDMNLMSVSGTFVSYSEEQVTLREGGQFVLIPRARVYRLNNLEKFHRVRSGVVGALVGAAAGIATGALIADAKADSSEISYGAYIGFLIGAGGGAALGATHPSHVTVYKSRLTPAPLRQ